MSKLKKLLIGAALITGLSGCAVFDPSVVAYRSTDGSFGFKWVNKADPDWSYVEEGDENYLWIGKPKRYSLDYSSEPLYKKGEIRAEISKDSLKSKEDKILSYNLEKDTTTYFLPME